MNYANIKLSTKYKHIFEEFKSVNIFPTFVDVFIFAVTIGVRDDMVVVLDDKDTTESVELPGSVLGRYENKKNLELLFQIAALTSNESIKMYPDEEERIEWAFKDEPIDEFYKIKFLRNFAEHGLYIIDETFRGETKITKENAYDILKRIKKYISQNYVKKEEYIDKIAFSTDIELDL